MGEVRDDGTPGDGHVGDRSAERQAAPHYHGHRDRLRGRFLEAVRRDTVDTLEDYEILELLLFHAIPRTDVKPLAKTLIRHFGSLGAVFAASPGALTRVPGVKEKTAALIKVVQAASLHMIREEVLDRPVLSSWERLLDYCHASMAYRDTEQFRILFLDRKNRLIADDLQQSGTVDHTPVYPREVVKRALELAASALILVHNHPSGDPQPSAADIAMTKQIAAAAEPLGVVLHDHVIIARTGYCSFKADGLL